MARQEPITVSGSIEYTGQLFIDGSEADTGAIDVFEIGGTGGCDIYREVDIDGDGNYELSVLIDSPSGEFHSQKNQLTVSQNANTRLEISNDSGSTQEYYFLGFEVADNGT